MTRWSATLDLAGLMAVAGAAYGFLLIAHAVGF